MGPPWEGPPMGGPGAQGGGAQEGARTEAKGENIISPLSQKNYQPHPQEISGKLGGGGGPCWASQGRALHPQQKVEWGLN